ncbi:hypothetical protein PPERSA_04087 [Pseudocohnilembus persalinus]|uniref:EF-hand domain-containing protein n=1 Tax=Pseudocohnilembus persalinus TaxID=266149 RepID=A0A0V0QKX9_PSEPJ|nr:hypothetical protein PPERSA_04087 [Pseudocohnilembus persalinus]|eukprot:KRX02884.1 hypothetical protein PPERSA_04087 [Pseudocohnilembus persalinus]
MSEKKDFHLTVGGLTDREGARAIAKKLFESYKQDSKDELKKNDISPMMVDAYKCMQKGFNPSKADVETYFQVLDRNSDGRVTLQDLEQLAIKYLVGDNSYSQQKMVTTQMGQYSDRQLVSQNSQDNNYLNKYEESQEQSQDPETNTITTTKTIKVQKKQITSTVTSSDGTSKTTQHQEINAIRSDSSNNNNENEQKKNINNNQQKQIKFNQRFSAQVEQKLDVARRLFKKFDTDGSGYITEEEVAPLLTATYKNMGVDYKPGESDIQEWIQMTDQDGDGKVSLEEYESLIVNSLQKAGIQID